jgi:hypothetical protein
VTDDVAESPSALGLGLCLRAAAVCAAVGLIGGTAVALGHFGKDDSRLTAGVGFTAGVVIAAASFLLSSLVIAWADTVDRRMILPVGLMTYVFKIVVIGMVVFGIARRDWPGLTPLLWGIAVGAASWIVAQATWTYRWAQSQPEILPQPGIPPMRGK